MSMLRSLICSANIYTLKNVHTDSNKRPCSPDPMLPFAREVCTSVLLHEGQPLRNATSIAYSAHSHTSIPNRSTNTLPVQSLTCPATLSALQPKSPSPIPPHPRPRLHIPPNLLIRQPILPRPISRRSPTPKPMRTLAKHLLHVRARHGPKHIISVQSILLLLKLLAKIRRLHPSWEAGLHGFLAAPLVRVGAAV